MNGPDAHSRGVLLSPYAKPRVLVAEDDQNLREFLCGLLEPFYDVEAAADGALAWEAMQHTIPALLLTDLQMPNLDGLELIRRLRAQPHLLSLPIIMLTACQEKETLLRCLAAGADDFLLKPFSCAELLACVQIELAVPRFGRDYGATYQTRLAAWEKERRSSMPAAAAATGIVPPA